MHEQQLPPQPLSQAGMQRRDQLRLELTQCMLQLHKRKKVKRTLVAAALPLLALGASAAALTLVRSTHHSSAPQVTQDTSSEIGEEQNTAALAGNTSVPERVALVQIQRISSSDGDEAIVDRYRVAGRTHLIQSIDDTGLLDLLTSIGRPAGLVRSSDRVWLTADVTDPLDWGGGGGL